MSKQHRPYSHSPPATAVACLQHELVVPMHELCMLVLVRSKGCAQHSSVPFAQQSFCTQCQSLWLHLTMYKT